MRTYKIEVQLDDGRLWDALLQRIKRRFPSDVVQVVSGSVVYTAWDDKTALDRLDKVKRIVEAFERENRLSCGAVQFNPSVPSCFISSLAHGE
jgi:hypothetical protein